MEHQGNIKRIVLHKNFGFIEANGKDNIFFHREDVVPQSSYTDMLEGDKVTFLMDKTPKGPRARNVKIVDSSYDTKGNV